MKPSLVTQHDRNASFRVVGVGGMKRAGMSMRQQRPSRASMALGRTKFVCNECGL